jgi:hypothetical protein
VRAGGKVEFASVRKGLVQQLETFLGRASRGSKTGYMVPTVVVLEDHPGLSQAVDERRLNLRT